MLSRSINPVIVVIIAIVLSACASLQPQPTPTETPLPPSATPEPTETPQPTDTPSPPTAGKWMSENIELTLDEVALNDPPMAGMAVVDIGDFVPFFTVEFTVGEDGGITEGVIRIYTIWVGMPINLAQTLGEGGCRYSFEDFIVGDDVVAGTFTSSSEASGTINNVETCVIGSEKLTFTTPLTAEWVATPSTE